jgi:hypothetical protein
MGFMVNAEKCLHAASLETTPKAGTGQPNVTGGLSFSPVSSSAFTLMDGAAWTSAFYAASIIEDSSAYDAERIAELLNKGVLISAKAHKSNSSKVQTVHIVDGGFVDSTGIVAQLQRQVRRIFVVYVVNRCLGKYNATNQCTNSTLATLFGVSAPTDPLDSLAGTQAQVFPSSLYEGVYANLTNQNLFARLTNVQVLRNDYLEVEPYVVDELIILSNAPSESFVDYIGSSADPDVRKNLDSHWPDRFSLSMNAYNANMLCLNQRYKLEQHSSTVKNFFARATDSNVGAAIMI